MKKSILFLLVLTVVMACSSPQKGDKRIVTVTIEPLRYFTEQIAGHCFEVKTMIPKGGNPETYEPTAQQMVDLSLSDLYIKVGHIGFERTWMKKLEANAPHTIIVDSSDGIVYLKSSNGIDDPHTWMSTANAVIIAQNIYHALASIDSKDSMYFKENLDNLIEKIADTDTKVRENLTKDKANAFVIYHPALTYFAHDYNLIQLPIEEEGREPSASQLKSLILKANELHVKTIFIQKEFSNRNTDIVAKGTGAKQEKANVLDYDWPKQMINIAKKLK